MFNYLGFSSVDEQSVAGKDTVVIHTRKYRSLTLPAVSVPARCPLSLSRDTAAEAVGRTRTLARLDS
jgi:hypothetical protein